MYLSPSEFTGLSSDDKSPPEASAASSALAVRVDGRHVYVAQPNASVSRGCVAMNGLQRRYSSLTLHQRVSLEVFHPTAKTTAASLVASLDVLGKGKGDVSVDTDDLGEVFRSNYTHHVFREGQILACQWKGHKLEVTVHKLQALQDDADGGAFGIDAGLGQLLDPTVVSFVTKPTSSLTLTGSLLDESFEGTGTVFTKNFDFVALGIGGLDDQFNTIFRRAFASRIWPSHVVKVGL